MDLYPTTQLHALFLPCSCSSAQRYLSHRSAQHALPYSGNTSARIIISQLEISLPDQKNVQLKNVLLPRKGFQAELKQSQANLSPTTLNPPNLQLSKISTVTLMFPWQKTFHLPVVMTYKFNIINNGDLNSPARATPQLYISTSTTPPPDLHSSLEETDSSALRLKSTFPNEVIYLEIPVETNTTTHEPWSLPRHPHTHWLLLQNLPRLLVWAGDDHTGHWSKANLCSNCRNLGWEDSSHLKGPLYFLEIPD